MPRGFEAGKTNQINQKDETGEIRQAYIRISARQLPVLYLKVKDWF
jgi:hypothetical protein